MKPFKTSIAMEPKLLARVKRLAAQEEISVSALITSFVHRCIDDAELAATARRDPLTERLIQEMLRPENIERAARIVGAASDDPDLFQQRAAALGRAAQSKVK